MTSDDRKVICEEHGESNAAFVCAHLLDHPVQRWFCAIPTEDNPYPDAWCATCNEAFLKEGEWNDRNEGAAPIKILCGGCYDHAVGQSVDALDPMQRDKWREFVESCCDETQDKQDALRDDFGIWTHERFDYDQATAELIFSNGGVPAVIANVEFVGSTSTRSGTWRWAWANFHMLDNVRSRIGAVRTFGVEKEYPHLFVPQWAAEEKDGWHMASVAAHVLDARGVYGAPSSNGRLFMAMTSLRLA
jgi:hypothetical protein